MAKLSVKNRKPPSSEILEMLAARRLVQLALELGFGHFVFDGDSEVIIKALVDGNFSLASIGHLVKDIMSISGLLQTQSLSHVRRQDNDVAYALALRVRLFFFFWSGWRIFRQTLINCIY